MARILVDTSVMIDYLRRKDKEVSLFMRTFITGKHQAVLPMVVVTELWAGKSMVDPDAVKFVEELMTHCEVAVSDLVVAKKAGELLRKSDYKLEFPDAEIAATAVVLDLPLLTLNKKHFVGIEGIEFWKV